MRTMAVVAAAVVLLLVLAAAAMASPSPTGLLLRARDVPGYTAVPSDIASLTDSNDQGPNQAFVACAGSTPLLDQFDSGSGATVGSLYGVGQDPFGAPAYMIGSVIFDDGSTTDADDALAALGSSSFQQCWAATQDKLNKAQGIAAPLQPSIVTPLAAPPYGQASTAFTVDQHYAAGSQDFYDQESLVAFQQGPVVVMLEDYAYNASFPTSVLDEASRTIAARLGAVQRSTATTSGTGACTSPLLSGGPPLLSTPEAIAAVGQRLSYAGWTRIPAAATGAAQQYTCSWRGAHVNGGPYYRGLSLDLSISGPYAIGEAKSVLDTAMQGWGASPVSGIGDDAFYMPEQDDAQGLEVLSGNMTFEIGMSADSPQAAAQHQQVERRLAQLVLGGLGTTTLGATGQSGTAGTSGSAPDCSFSVSPEFGPEWVDELNSDFQRYSRNKLPVSVATLNLPGPLFLNFAPSIELYSFDICASGLIGDITQEPSATSDSLAFTAQPADCGTGLANRLSRTDQQGNGVPCSPKIGLYVDGEATLGGFDYSGPIAAWTSVDPKATPGDQDFTTTWQPKYSVLPGVSGSWSASEGPDAELTLLEIQLASYTTKVELVVASNAALDAEFGPSLVFDVQLSNKSLTQQLADDLKEGESEPEAAENLAKEVIDDANAAVQAEDGGFYGQAPAQIEETLEKTMDQDLIDAFNEWFASIKAGSPVANELVSEGVTPNEVPASAQTALEDTGTEAFSFGDVLDACLEDPEVCLVLAG
ncbi:MAG: hypothetical protein ABSG64_09470 [Solirubrobacteraceae bacterium]